MFKRTVLIAASAFVLGIVITSAQNRALPEGARPYTPTRLQWLALDMEARMHKDLSTEDGFSLDFVGLDKDNAILIYVRYLPSADREIMNSIIENAKTVIGMSAKSEGWPWLKIREDVKMVPPKKSKP